MPHPPIKNSWPRLCWQFDNDITYRRHDNVMMFTWGTHKIPMTPILHFDKSTRENKYSFLVLTHDEKELDEAVTEIECFCPVVSKALMSVVKEEVSISEEVLEILRDFKELITSELPNNLPRIIFRWTMLLINAAELNFLLSTSMNIMQKKLFIKMRARGQVFQRWRRLM